MTFCDTTCMTDTLKFTGEEFELKPYIFISASECLPDSVIWSYSGMGINRKLGFSDLTGTVFPVSREKMQCYFNDTSFVWLIFNNCENGRGYFIKIPFNKSEKISRKSSALTGFDPKFRIEEGLVAYTDRGNIFVEEMSSGKEAMMTFGEMLDMDYDALHEFIDSVNISRTRIWARVLIGKEWQELEKEVSLQ